MVLESKYGSPRIVNDGVTVAREVELEDPVENIGAKLVRQVRGAGCRQGGTRWLCPTAEVNECLWRGQEATGALPAGLADGCRQGGVE